ncbi:MAG TPA: hypothetical protein PKD79_01015 [Candidatus Doudnabacteria bacterium]|nr:hypothetical protein [Candidatus Doudnabacteria bacterium]
MSEDRTVPFFKIPKDDRTRAIANMREYTGSDPSKLTAELVQTAFKAVVGPGSKVVGVPRVVNSQLGPTLRIPIKNSDPAFASLAQLRTYI